MGDDLLQPTMYSRPEAAVPVEIATETNQLVTSCRTAVPRVIGLEARRYVVVLAIVAIAVVLRFLLEPYLEQSGFAIFLGAVLLAAWVGGIIPSLIGQTLLLVAAALWFGRPNPGPWRPSVEAVIGVVAYYLVGTTVAALSQMTTAAKKRAQAEKDEAISQREQLLATLACIGDGVVVTNASGQITLMNEPAERMTGWSISEARGRSLPSVFGVLHADDHQPVKDLVRSTIRDSQVLHQTVPVRLSARDGTIIPIAYTASPILNSDAEMTGVVLVFRDESDRLHIEETLRGADRRKDEFLATLAHELRNPLAPISMGLELLKMSGSDPTVQEEVRSMMDRQAKHMVRLIDDLLDVSRITRGKVELRRQLIELSEVVRNAIDATRPFLEESGHQLQVNLPIIPVFLNADFNRLTQVFSNLLNNAAKYTPRGGRIELTATQKSGKVTVAISDSGIGVPAEMQELIFELFTQVKNAASADQGGLGIGLTLVKRLTEMHGGTVEMESAGAGKGSIFRVHLPTVPSPQVIKVSPEQKEPPERKSRTRRVLVVDGNEDALNSLSRMVELLGHTICKAHDGLEAVKLAKQIRPDIVLLDLGMPKLDGYDAARQIRQELGGERMVLVATTGWGQTEDRRRTKEAGFDHHLVKPIDTTALQAILSGTAPRPMPVSAGESWTL